LEIARLTQERDRYAVQLNVAGRLRFSDPQALADLPRIRESWRSAEDQLSKRMADRLALRLVAPCDGWVLPPPSKAAPTRDSLPGRLPVWTGTPLEPSNVGCFLESETLFCQVGDPRALEAVLVVDQADVEFVQEGFVADLKLDQLPHHEYSGSIVSVAQQHMRLAPPHLSSKAGGELATESDESGLERPQSPSYQARVLLPPSDDLRLGLRGRAKVHAPPRTAVQRIWRYFQQTFRFSVP